MLSALCFDRLSFSFPSCKLTFLRASTPRRPFPINVEEGLWYAAAIEEISCISSSSIARETVRFGITIGGLSATVID